MPSHWGGNYMTGVVLMKQKLPVKDLVFIALNAAVICVLAPISLTVNLIPFTLATLAVYLCTAISGARRGTLSVLVYILIGAVGVPVFSGFSGGIHKLVGLTGGYIVGYIFCALAEGLLIDRLPQKLWIYPVAMVLGTLLLYAFGTAWFTVVGGKGLIPALSACVVPFLPFDILKIAVASGVAYPVRRQLTKRGLL